MPLLKRELCQMEQEKIAVAFPDEGAWKRFHSDLSRWPSITCIKVREGERRAVSIKDGEGRETDSQSILFLRCLPPRR